MEPGPKGKKINMNINTELFYFIFLRQTSGSEKRESRGDYDRTMLQASRKSHNDTYLKNCKKDKKGGNGRGIKKE
jgi:hypothetical protein